MSSSDAISNLDGSPARRNEASRTGLRTKSANINGPPPKPRTLDVVYGGPVPGAPESAKLQIDEPAPIPSLLLPLPGSISQDLALAICFEIQRLFQRDHVASMSKKEVRHWIEQQLLLRKASYDEDEVPIQFRSLMNVSLDLSLEEERREWVNKCITIFFQRHSLQKQGE